MALVKRFFKGFGYEQLLIRRAFDSNLGEVESTLATTTVNRSWVKALELELFEAAKMQQDNKCGFIFRAEGDYGLITAISFWDYSATFMSWGECWKRTPHNLSVYIRVGRIEAPTLEELGILLL